MPQAGPVVIAQRAELAARLRDLGGEWWEAHGDRMLVESPQVYNQLFRKHKQEPDKDRMLGYCLGMGFPGAHCA